MKDVLSKVSIWTNIENRKNDDGNEVTMERVAENQRNLRKGVKGLQNQLDGLMEEISDNMT